MVSARRSRLAEDTSTRRTRFFLAEAGTGTEGPRPSTGALTPTPASISRWPKQSLILAASRDSPALPDFVSGAQVSATALGETSICRHSLRTFQLLGISGIYVIVPLCGSASDESQEALRSFPELRTPMWTPSG
jgi:hypothetical protein